MGKRGPGWCEGGRVGWKLPNQKPDMTDTINIAASNRPEDGAFIGLPSLLNEDNTETLKDRINKALDLRLNEVIKEGTHMDSVFFDEYLVLPVTGWDQRWDDEEEENLVFNFYYEVCWDRFGFRRRSF